MWYCMSFWGTQGRSNAIPSPTHLLLCCHGEHNENILINQAMCMCVYVWAWAWAFCLWISFASAFWMSDQIASFCSTSGNFYESGQQKFLWFCTRGVSGFWTLFQSILSLEHCGTERFSYSWYFYHAAFSLWWFRWFAPLCFLFYTPYLLS